MNCNPQHRDAVLSAPGCFVGLQKPDPALEPLRPRFSFADVPSLSIALRKGDQAAFRFLYEQWNHRIVRYCFALSAGDDVFAMEVAQATYVRIFKHLPLSGDENALWNWMARAARCAANDLRRVNRRYRSALGRFGDWLRFGPGRSHRSTPDSLFTALDRGLAALSEDDRRVLEARYFSRMSLDEIAQTNRLSVRAVEGRLARARERLRVTIADALNQDEP